MQAFSSFRGAAKTERVIWQPSDSIFPFECQQCHRVFEKGGKRWLGSSIAMQRQTHFRALVLCEDCHAGRDPHRKPAPVLAKRRTELD